MAPNLQPKSGMRGWDTTPSQAPGTTTAWRLALLAPRLYRGAAFHRAALQVAAAGDLGLADRLFEAAADRYRDELQVEPLARLRVHQLMYQAAASDAPVELALEVERRLLKLRRIESPRAPFALVAASTLVGVWPAQVSTPAADDPPTRGSGSALAAA